MLLTSPSRFRTLALAFLGISCSAGGGPDTSREARTVTVVADVVYARKLGMALTFDVFRPEHPNGGAVLFISSGGFVSGQARQYERIGWNSHHYLEAHELHLEGDPTPIPLLEQFSFTPLLEAGLTVFDVRHGSSPTFRLPGIVDDLDRAVRFVRSHAADLEVDPDRIGVWGASSGGYLALYLALTRGGGAASVDRSAPGGSGIRTVAVYYPAGFDFASDAERFPELFQALPALQVERAVLDSLSLKHHLTATAPPTLIIYGTDDFPFIVEPSEAVCAGLTAAGAECRRIAIPGTGHEFRGAEGYHPEHGQRALAEVAAWFGQKLGGREGR
jgi:acetyl esterase/lipase